MAEQKTADQLTLSEIETELRSRKAEKGALELKFQSLSTAQLLSRQRVLQKAIYGTDDRKDFHEFPNDRIRTIARSVAALFHADDVIDNGDGTSTLRTKPFNQRRELCGVEKFREQPTGAFCSGFLVAPDIVATAGHCVRQSNLADVAFVFGFRMADVGNPVLTLPTSDVYRGRALVGRVNDPHGPDWALAQLDRIVSDRLPLGVRRSGRVDDEAGVYVIGHPSQLPIKFAGQAYVRDNTPATFFIANLDAYGGNSGSPVFGSDDVVEGVLVRGEADFELSVSGGCWVSKVCPTTGCQGEHCTRTVEFAHLIPE